MALKSFNELIKIDVRPQCDTRDAKDENGKTIKVPYLSWGKCVKLLHENGANDVWYAPVECPTTHTYLWPQAKVSTSKGRDTECWFVRVLIHIDDLEFVYDTPLLNGSMVVYTDTLNQLRINNALARAFVKGVAIRTGLGFDLDGNDTLENGEDLYKKFWPADLHLIGKDILRFHTIYWPIMLMALDLPLPKQVFGHPWLLQGDGKMSKSKGNVIYADDLVDIFGVDAVRYFVLHEMPFENDGVISWDLMVERMNSDLANVLGNLVNRTISMTNKYLSGVVADKGVSEEVDDNLKQFVLATPAKVTAKMDQLRVADAITEVFALFKRCNKYIDETEPWVLGKDEAKKDRLSTVLYNLVEAITIGASLLEAFMPNTTDKILAQLGAQKRAYDQMDQFGLYQSGGHVVEKPEILFMRLDPKEVLAKAEEIKQKQIAEAKAESGETEEEVIDIEPKEEITFDDFMKMQFQVGEIIACEEVKKSKKLLCSQVKIGSEVKQIVSGIKQHYSAEEMVGKKVMVLVNLKPAKLAGVLSEGMLLCAEDAEGNLALMAPEKTMPAGAEIC